MSFIWILKNIPEQTRIFFIEVYQVYTIIKKSER